MRLIIVVILLHLNWISKSVSNDSDDNLFSGSSGHNLVNYNSQALLGLLVITSS